MELVNFGLHSNELCVISYSFKLDFFGTKVTALPLVCGCITVFVCLTVWKLAGIRSKGFDNLCTLMSKSYLIIDIYRIGPSRSWLQTQLGLFCVGFACSQCEFSPGPLALLHLF